MESSITHSFRSYKMSELCQRITNPIIHYIESDINIIPSIDLSSPNRPKEPINLSYGDPSVYKDFKPFTKDLEILSEAVGRYDGYVDFSGIFQVRTFLKEFYTAKSNFNLMESDIFITHGCSMALWLAINSIAEKGDNILVPKPGFQFWNTVAISQNINIKEYKLISEKKWEIDLKHLDSLIDEKTKAILINNPNNPTGSVFSREHIQEILKIAEKHSIPIIADEVYEEMVYSGEKFCYFAEVSKTVPILSIGGLTKRHFGPGWRTGWLILHGPKGIFDEIKIGINNLLSIIMNSNSICMQSIPKILGKSETFLTVRMEIIQKRIEILKENLKGIEAYKVIDAYGAIYAVIIIDLSKFKDIKDTKDFCIKLYKTQNTLCVPAECFGDSNFIRIVVCAEEVKIKEFCNRMKEFFLDNKKE